MEGSVTVIIKAANQSVPDQHLECELGWSVSTLKGHLSRHHPSHPRVEEQRLIYSGQLLGDHLLLRDTLRHPTENNAYTIHLVCSPPRQPPPPQPQRLLRPSPPQEPDMEPERAAPQEGPLAGESNDGIRRRHVANSSAGGEVSPTAQTIEAAAAATAAHASLPLGVLQASADPMHQVAAMQQMYAHYMAYMQYMQMGGGVGGLPWPQQMIQIPPPPNPATTTTTTTTSAAAAPATTPAPLTEPAEQPQVDANLPADPQQAPPAPQPQPQIRMNAQGGEVDEEDEDEGMGRDWLDRVYVLSRMLVLLSIVYFYSTLSRFMVVVCVALLLYLYQAGWFRPARRVDPPPPPANENDIQDDRNNNINNNNNNNEAPVGPRQQEAVAPEAAAEEAALEEPEEGGARPSQDQGTRQVVEEMPVRPSLLALSWTFLTTFFTSLVPEQPQGI